MGERPCRTRLGLDLHRRRRGRIPADDRRSLAERRYPRDAARDRNWQSLLLNQFHDILPGSSINEVYLDTHCELRAVVDTATALCDTAISILSREGKSGTAIANPLLHLRPLTAILPEGAATGAFKGVRQAVEGGTLIHAPVVTVEGFGFVNSVDKGKIIETVLLRFTIGADGTIHEVGTRRPTAMLFPIAATSSGRTSIARAPGMPGISTRRTRTPASR